MPSRAEERRQPDPAAQRQERCSGPTQYTPEKAGELAKTHDIGVVSVRGYNGIGHRKYDGQDLVMFVEEECTREAGEPCPRARDTPIVAMSTICAATRSPFPGSQRTPPPSWSRTALIGMEPRAITTSAAVGPTSSPASMSRRGVLRVQIPRSMEQVKAQREDLPFDLGCTKNRDGTRLQRPSVRGESPPRDLGDPRCSSMASKAGDRHSRNSKQKAAQTAPAPRVRNTSRSPEGVHRPEQVSHHSRSGTVCATTT